MVGKSTTKKPTRSTKSTKSAKSAPPPEGYSVDWFSEHAHLWQRHLASASMKKHLAGIASPRALVIGPHEGMTCEWLLQNVLQSPKARLVCIDKFDRYGDCIDPVSADQAKIRAALERNVLQNPAYAGKASLIEAARTGLWHEAARLALASTSTSAGSGAQFSVVLIDHMGRADETLELATVALRLLRPGGIMVITNYTHAKEHDGRCPRPGIDRFLDTFAPQIRVLQTAWHTFVQKREQQLPMPPCMSELFDPHPPLKECVKRSGARASSGAPDARKQTHTARQKQQSVVP